MCDTTEQRIREQKIKFIEIFLIVGGLIGSSLIRDGDPMMNGVFGAFLIGSLLYYLEVSNAKKNSIFDYLSIITSTVIISFSFSSIAILPFKSLDSAAIELAIYQNTINIILWLLLMVFIAMNLYLPKRYFS